MKKSLLFVIASLLLPIALGAQPLQFKSAAYKSWGTASRNLAPAMVELAENQKIMGHYDNDSIAHEGYAMQNSSLVPLAIMLEPDELDVFQGGKIVSFRVGLVEAAKIARVFVIPVSDKGKYGDKTEWLCDVGQEGWNEVVLETPYEINLEEGYKLLVGFYYQQLEGCKPISFVQQGLPYDTYTYKKVGTSAKWRELGLTSKGNLSIQCVVEKEDYPDYMITSYGLRSNNFVVRGEELPFLLNVKNKGIKQVEAGALEMDVKIDGRHVATATNADAFHGDYYALVGSAPTEGLSSGEHVLTVQAVSVDGQPIEDTPYDFTFKAYQRDFPRQKHLVEQLTSTYCTYCPLGNSMLSILTSQRDDIIWVGIHGNLGSGVDPYRSNQGDSIMQYLTGGAVSYPSGSFDRSTGWEDYVNIVNGLGFYEEYHQMVADELGGFFDYIAEATPSFADIKADCSFNESTRVATVSVRGKMSADFDMMMGEDAMLTVYVVEDSLVAPQLNLGNWENKYVHNGVFRRALGSIFGNELNKNGNTYKNTFRFTIPASWNWTRLRVVAFISRPMKNYVNGFTDMFVDNADVFRFHTSTGIDEIVADEDAVPVEYYDYMGRQLDGPQQGVNIVRMSDGTARKILMK